VTGSLLILGFTLSLDNFRTAIALGGLRFNWGRSVQIAMVFGVCDAVAPLVGILVGRYWSETIGSTAEYVGAGALAAYGVYLIIRAWRTAASEQFDRPWAVCGLLVPLSADNVVAGTSLGLLGFSPWLAPPVFGVITALVALVGLQIGRAVAHVIPMRPDLVTGIALVVMATVMGPQL
jgi:manganese efflux pump family protein